MDKGSYNHKIKERYNRIAPIYDRLEAMMEKGELVVMVCKVLEAVL